MQVPGLSVQTNAGGAFTGQLSLVAVGQSDARIGVGQFSVDTHFQLTPTTGGPGTSVTANAQNLPGGQMVNLFIGTTFLGAAKAYAGGAFSFDFTVPANLTNGGYNVVGKVKGQTVFSGAFQID
jgi:hypothetical protein